MRIVILSDLHFDYEKNHNLTNRKEKAVASLGESADCILLCGDNAELNSGFSNHRKLFDILRDSFNGHVGFIAGNHDLWGGTQISSGELLWQVFPSLAKKYGFTYIETENLDLGKVIIAGTYGHYDYSLGNERNGITRQNFLSGMAVIDRISYRWMDKEYMNWEGKTDGDVTETLVRAFEKRIPDTRQKIITLSHTCPNIEAVGYPDSPKRDFLGAFFGTTKLEEVLRERVPLYHFCGHTHAPTQSSIGKTKVLNIGTDYGNFKYVLLDTDSDKVEMLSINL